MLNLREVPNFPQTEHFEYFLRVNEKVGKSNNFIKNVISQRDKEIHRNIERLTKN